MKLLIAVFVCSLLSAPDCPAQTTTASARRASAAIPTPRRDPNSMLAHEQLVAKAKSGRIDLYFLGDSITRRWGCSDPQWSENLANWKQNLFGWNAGNFGWGGDGIQNMLWRIQNGELAGVNPKVIVILAGTNNVGTKAGDDAKVADILNGFDALIATCRENAPQAKIIITAIFPRNDNPAVLPEIRKINDGLEKRADGQTVLYLNVNDKLADADGNLHDGMTIDKLHLSLKGYQVWADGLTPVLTKILGARADTDHAPPPTGDPSVAAASSAPPATTSPAVTPEAASITYVDATDGREGNTLTAADPDGPVRDGVQWQTNSNDAADHLWRKRTGLGLPAGTTSAPAGSTASIIATTDGTLHESTGLAESVDNVARLKTTISSLRSATYDVYVFFWSDQTNSPWRIRAGLTDSPDPLPLYVGGGTPSGQPAPILIGHDRDKRKLFQVKLGSVTGTSITVFVEDDPGDSGNTRTWYDGIGYIEVPRTAEK